MAEQETEERAPSEEESGSKSIVGKKAFTGINKSLSDDDLANPAVAKMLLEQRDQYFDSNVVLETFVERYYTAEKRAAVAEKTLELNGPKSLLLSLCHTLGGVLFGSAFAISNTSVSWIVLAIGIILILVSSIIMLFNFGKIK